MAGIPLPGNADEVGPPRPIRCQGQGLGARNGDGGGPLVSATALVLHDRSDAALDGLAGDLQSLLPLLGGRRLASWAVRRAEKRKAPTCDP